MNAGGGEIARALACVVLELTGVEGVIVGVVAAMVSTRLMAALLFGVGPMDPMTYVAVSLVLGAIALVATYVPARRASRVDPIVALRTDV